MAGNLEEIRQLKLLLGEGPEDVLFFKSLLMHLDISGIQVEHYGGKDNLHAALKALSKRPGFASVKSLAITRDADFVPLTGAAQAAFQSVCSGLKNAGLPVPTNLEEKVAGLPEVCIFILPDCRGDGMLEDLCLASLVASSPAQHQSEMKCIETYLMVAQLAGRKQERHRTAKAYVQAWLATQSESDKKLGEA